MVHESWKRPADWFETNILSQTKLIELIKNIKHLKIFLNFSTPEVYGDTTSKQISEDFNFNPSTPYAISRACFDTYLISKEIRLLFLSYYLGKYVLIQKLYLNYQRTLQAILFQLPFQVSLSLFYFLNSKVNN